MYNIELTGTDIANILIALAGAEDNDILNYDTVGKLWDYIASEVGKQTDIGELDKPKGLVIRYFMSGYYLCDGKPPTGFENDGELYVGNTVRWFEKWEEADEMKKMIENAYEIE